MISLAEFSAEFMRLSEQLDEAQNTLERQVHAYSASEHDYRRAKSEAWVECPVDDGSREWTAARREAWVNSQTAQQRYERDVAEGLRQAALESIRSTRGQISALQTLVNAYQEEAKFVRTAP